VKEGRMDFLFGRKGAPGITVYTEHDNNEYSPLFVIGGIHVYPEGFGILVVFASIYFYFLRRNYRPDKPKPFYE